MKTIGDKQYAWFPGISIAYKLEDSSDYSWYFEYNLTYRKIKDVQTFITTSEHSPDIVASIGADLILSLNNFDLAISKKTNNSFSYTIGPTVSFVNRTFVIDNLPQPTQEISKSSLEDRLVSVCIGLNGSIEIESSIHKNILFFSSLRLRYLHSVWFDARGRNLDNYFQELVFAQLNIGLGCNI